VSLCRRTPVERCAAVAATIGIAGSSRLRLQTIKAATRRRGMIVSNATLVGSAARDCFIAEDEDARADA